ANRYAVPFTNRFHRVFPWFHQIVDRPGVVVASVLAVEDLHLDSVIAHVLARPRRQRRGADEDAAVAALADLEIAGQDEIVPLLFMDHHVMAALVRVDAAVLDRPFAWLLVARHPAIERLAVEEQDPAFGLLFR